MFGHVTEPEHICWVETQPYDLQGIMSPSQRETEIQNRNSNLEYHKTSSD